MPISRTALRFLPLILLACACPSALAQQSQQQQQPAAAVAVTAAATDRGVRFTAPGGVVRVRLEVYADTGPSLFDLSGKGSVLDWALEDGGGRRVSDGSYLCVVTVKGLDGKLSQRIGTVSVEGGRVSLRGAQATELSSAQQQQVGPVEDDAAMSVREEGDTPSAAVVAHDGRDAQVTATTGALTLRTGDVFAGKDRERMRLTEDGKVGIGTADPQATLDVAGEVRAREGFRFSDGSRLTVSDAGALVRLSADGSPLPGWGAGPDSQAGAALADTVVDGNLVFSSPGTPNYGRDIRLSDNLGGVRIFGAPSLTAQPAGAAIQFFGNGHTLFPGQAFVDAGAHNSAAVIFRSAPGGGTIAERMRVTATGNVGIGTNNPQAKLHVAGAVNFTGLRTFDAASPNVIGGQATNAVTPDVVGATIAGGGGTVASHNNRVTDDYGTVGGGRSNQAGNNGGSTSDRGHATVGGGFNNTASGVQSTIGGGFSNLASTLDSTVGGGGGNTASGNASTVGGGTTNTASGIGSTVGGGIGNTASGIGSTVPGGQANTAQGDYSFAAGLRAKVEHQGSFVWSDSTTPDTNFFASTAANQFLIRAGGGVGINTTAPGATLDVAGPIRSAAGGFIFPDGSTQTTAATGAVSAAGVSAGQFGVNTGGGTFSFPANVGIGTAAPENSDGWARVLDISGNLHAKFSLRTSVIDARVLVHDIGFWGAPAGMMVGTNTNHPLSFGTGGAFRMIIAGGGNVGIGTTAPARKLHVSDAMRLQPIASPPSGPASGDLYFDTSEALCVYVGGAWAKLAGAGACN